MDGKINTTAIVLAAGLGKRMNSKIAKQYLILKDHPILYYSLKAFEKSNVDNIVLVVAKNEIEFCKENIIEKYGFNKINEIVEGGSERYNSVYNALLEIDDSNYVMIHDGVRPLIDVKDINNMIDYLKKNGPCIYGVEAKETIKIINEDKYVVNTPMRDKLWVAQTPQSFECGLLKQAYQLMYSDKTNLQIKTDDSSVYEQYIKKPIKVLVGKYSNIKVTTPEDIVVAEEYLKNANKS